MSEKFTAKASTTKDLLIVYGISYKTFNAWLEKIREKVGSQEGKRWTVRQVEIMLEHWGTPGEN